MCRYYKKVLGSPLVTSTTKTSDKYGDIAWDVSIILALFQGNPEKVGQIQIDPTVYP